VKAITKKKKEICITPPPTAVAASPRYPQSIIMQYNNVDASHVYSVLCISLDSLSPKGREKLLGKYIGNYYHYIVHLICLHLVPNHPLSPLSLSNPLNLNLLLPKKEIDFSSLQQRIWDVLLQSSLLFVV
jgi:hypothetical protein